MRTKWLGYLHPLVRIFAGGALTDMYEVPDAVPLIHAVSSHVATDKDPSKFRSIFSDNLQPIATRGKIARGMLLVDIGCSSERAPPSLR